MTRIHVSLRALACAVALAALSSIAGTALAQSNRPASLERERPRPSGDGAPILSVRIRPEINAAPDARSELTGQSSRAAVVGQVSQSQDATAASPKSSPIVAPENDAAATDAKDAKAVAKEETDGSEPAESEDGAIDAKSLVQTDKLKTQETDTEETIAPAEKPSDEPSPNGVDGAAAQGEAAAEPAPLKTPVRNEPKTKAADGASGDGKTENPKAESDDASKDDAPNGKVPDGKLPGDKAESNKAGDTKALDAKLGEDKSESSVDGNASKGADASDKRSQEPRTLGNAPDAVAVPTFEQDLTPELLELRDRVRKTLSWYYNEPISVNSYSPWGIMHALIAFGVDTQVYNQDQKVNAIGWLCYNNACRGQRLMYLENGKLRVDIGVGVQGHAGQFLSMLAQSRVRTDFPIKVEGRDFTVADLIESEKETCRARTELTFKLIALAHYLKTDATWKSDIGEEWSIPRLIKEELAQPVVGSACGGTHRMTGFSYAVNKRTKLNEPFEGQWLRGRKFVHAFHDYIFKLQNSDGSFSTNWFAGRGDSGEIKRHLETTGHMLEWLVCSLPSDQLDDPRVIQAVDHLTSVFEYGMRNGVKWEIGPRGHGLHALALYAERRFGDKPGSREAIFARRNSTKAVVR
ncbi:MAG: hypothetical protein ACKO38_15615 [Planctomycetota bacterium]